MEIRAIITFWHRLLISTITKLTKYQAYLTNNTKINNNNNHNNKDFLKNTIPAIENQTYLNNYCNKIINIYTHIKIY